MAKRFGGKYSPDGADSDLPLPRGQFDGARVDPAGARSNLLFLPGVLLVFLSLNDGAIGLSLALVAAAVLTLAAWLLREGLRAQAAYDARNDRPYKTTHVDHHVEDTKPHRAIFFVGRFCHGGDNHRLEHAMTDRHQEVSAEEGPEIGRQGQ